MLHEEYFSPPDLTMKIIEANKYQTMTNIAANKYHKIKYIEANSYYKHKHHFNNFINT